VVFIISNIAEGFECGGRGELHQFLSTARASCVEVCPQLHITPSDVYLDQAIFDRLMEQAEEVARILGELRVAVDEHRKDGKR